MYPEPTDPSADSLPLARPGLLSPALRRDLADLNAQYLELGAVAAPPGDLRFRWSELVHRRLADLEAGIRQRMAAAPFALFQLVVPPATLGEVAGIADVGRGMSDTGWRGRCASFAYQAAFFARRLSEGAPLAAHVVLDLPRESQSVLASLRPSQIAEYAAHPGFVRPRWPHHQRVWRMLEVAARDESSVATQWAHCVGVCLLGVDDDDPAAADPTGARRRPRR